ncbi:rRNA-processing protein UTP23 homolog isoform X4 [Camellia sinensis]|uniref:rRNA-processing protein UTP23 homolog isoform X4 n=1 Tax=Camellia sinensis TaxID=4442 RepID=UPI001035BE06|nr:rRNA-processing protein UTP23 homolog isoform X4 [Camellia sinensis]
MRLKKQKRHRKVVRFYTACFGFREPFKVLCDGTFVHHLHVNSITPANTALSNILGATVKIFTTRCVLAELKSLGESYSESLKAARNLFTARCDHEKRKSAVACIVEIIGEDNPEHFFVATQDADLRKNLQELKVPGVPVIFGLRNALMLEPPSAFQHQFAKSTEEERSHMTEFEYKMLRMKKKNMLAMEEARESSGVNGSEGDLGTLAVMNANSGRKGKEVKDKVQFKRKKAKGPNPLSSKKKKNCGHAKANLVSEKSRCRTAMMAVKPQEPGAGNGKDYVSKAKSLK